MDRLRLIGREDLAPRHETGRDGHGEMWRPEIRARLIRVDMLDGCWTSGGSIPEQDRRGPREEVVAFAAGDAADAVAVPDAEVGHVFALGLRPEGHVLRVEYVCVGNRLPRHDRRGGHSLPAIAIGRFPGGDAALDRSAEGLETLGLGHSGACVAEGGEIVARLVGVHQHDAVGLGAVGLVEAEFGLGPGAAVLRLGDAGHLVLAAVTARDRLATVIRAQAAVGEPDHGHHAAEGPLPRFVEGEGDTLLARCVELEASTIELVDEEPIDEELAPVADVNRIGGVGKQAGEAGEQQEQGSFHGVARRVRCRGQQSLFIDGVGYLVCSNLIEYRFASFMTKRRRTGLPAKAARSGFSFQRALRATVSP